MAKAQVAKDAAREKEESLRLTQPRERGGKSSGAQTRSGCMRTHDNDHVDADLAPVSKRREKRAKTVLSKNEEELSFGWSVAYGKPAAFPSLDITKPWTNRSGDRHRLKSGVGAVDEADLDDSAVETLSAYTDEEAENLNDMMEMDVENHEDASLILALRIESKYLARLRSWGTKAVKTLPPQQEKPRPPPPAIPTTIIETNQEDEGITKAPFDRERTADTESTLEAVEVAALRRLTAPSSTPALLATLEPRSPISPPRPPQPTSETKPTLIHTKKRASPPLDHSDDLETIKAPNKKQTKLPPACNRPSKLQRLPRSHKQALQEVHFFSEPGPMSKHASLLDSVPKGVVQPPAMSQQMDLNEPIIIENYDDNLDLLFGEPFPPAEVNKQQVCQLHHGTTQADNSRAFAPAQASQPNITEAEKRVNNLRVFDQRAEGLFGGLHPSSMAKRKWSSLKPSTRTNVVNNVIPSPTSEATVSADKEDDTMRLASGNADGSYARKKHRLEVLSQTPSAQHRLWAKGHAVARQPRMVPCPVSSYKKPASPEATPAQSVQNQQENVQPQIPNSGLRSRNESSDIILPMSSTQQPPGSMPRNRTQHNHANHMPPYLSVVSQQTRAQHNNRALPTETARNLSGPSQNISPSQLQGEVEAANRAFQSTETAQMRTPRRNNGPPTIVVPPNSNHVPQHLDQAQLQGHQLRGADAQNAMQHQYQHALANNGATVQSYQGLRNSVDIQKGNPSMQPATGSPSIQNYPQRQQQHFAHGMWPPHLPVDHLSSSYVDEHRLLSEQQNARNLFESVQAPSLLEKNQQAFNVTAPSDLSPPYRTSNLSVRQFHPNHLSPTSAQAALAQIRTRHPQYVAPIKGSNEFMYAQQCDTAQQEIARVHAVQSHHARLQKAFGSQGSPGVLKRHASSMQQTNDALRSGGANGRMPANNVHDPNHPNHCFARDTEK